MKCTHPSGHAADNQGYCFNCGIPIARADLPEIKAEIRTLKGKLSRGNYFAINIEIDGVEVLLRAPESEYYNLATTLNNELESDQASEKVRAYFETLVKAING